MLDKPSEHLHQAAVAGGIQAGSINIGMLIAGRALAGISSGMLLALVPVYIAEIAPPQKRAFLVGMQGLMTWRIPLAMQIPAPIVMLVGCYFIPFSPRWLVKQERYEEAKAVLVRLQGHMGQEFVDREFIQIQEQISFEVYDRNLPWYKAAIALFSKQYLKRTLLACFIVAMSQLSGTSVISNFQNVFYGIVGVKGKTSLLVSGVFGTMGVIGTVIYLFFVADKWRRTTTLWVGALSMCITLSICIALSAEFPTGSPDISGGYAAIAFIFIYSTCFAIFFNDLIYAASSELFPHFLRSKGMSVAVWGKAVIAIVISQITPVAVKNISWRYYSVYISFNAVAAFIFYFMLPETRGKTLEEVAALFGVAPH
ncbi:hypothetical protein B0O99DRAFT_653230 [Bisporella sp. PMI_857]|nr:hypothetical protein B0O99DRAFT_653230 [Bisporella sp. PMI_857]